MTAPAPLPYADVFVGDSAMALALRAHDWEGHPMGDPARWPHTLKVALRILLTSRFEMWLGWGNDIHFFFNDAYRPTLGIKAAGAIGRPCREVWAEIWDDVKGRMEAVMQRGESTWDRALLLVLERSGYPEETYHTFSYSPLLGDDGRVGGLFCTVTEDTDRVISERRLDSLRDLAARLAPSNARHGVLDGAAAALGAATRDLPFALVYTFDADGTARRALATGLAPGHALAPAAIAPGGADPWGAAALWDGAPLAKRPLDAAAGLGTGAWSVPPRDAVSLPIAGAERPLGFLVAGLNPYRPFNVAYQSFLELMAGQVGAGLRAADAAEDERAHVHALAEAARLRQEAAEALRQANATLASEVAARTAERDDLRGLFEHSPSFVAVLRGPRHVFELANASYQQLVGRTDLLGKDVLEAMPEVAGQGFMELLDGVLARGEAYVGRAVPLTLRRPDGGLREHFVDFVYQPMRNAQGACDGIFVEGHDVTDRVLGEQAVRALNETLESRIAERTQELNGALQQVRAEAAARENAQAALRQSQKMEAVGQLTGGIAHDFNNLLQGITGSLELLRRRVGVGKPEDVQRYIEEGMKSARRAAALTHRLLAFSRRQPLAPTTVLANPLIGSMEDLLRRTLGERIALALDLDAALCATLCDANQLESALLNLCINARDAMPAGGSLTIATRNVDAEAVQGELAGGRYVEIAVADTGTGMPPDVAARAFDPFFTTKPIGQGTGLGLSMIYGFARQSGGSARIDTAVGCGTTVRLLLPCHDDAAQQADEAAAVFTAAGSGSGTVLVIEDEDTVRRLVVDILAELGYEALEAADGQAGLDILGGPRRIDLLVTDMGLPGLNGRQVADAARVGRPGLRVLFMTGYAENAARAEGFLEPGMEMIVKPFGLDALAATLRRLLEGPDADR